MQERKLTDAEKKRAASKRKMDKRIPKKEDVASGDDPGESKIERSLIRMNQTEDALEDVEEEKTVETLTSRAARAAIEQAVMQTPEFRQAVETALTLFAPFVVYEQDAPEEARLMLFPAFMHITKEQINAEIVQRYSPVKNVSGGEPADLEDLEDLKIVQEGIDDSISILKKRTGGDFPTPGARALNQLEYEVLSALAYTETVLFYRMGEDDLLRGYIELSSQYRMRANQPKGTRVRSWVSVDKFAAKFVDPLSDDSVEDMVMALVEKDAEIDAGYTPYFMRWREAELI